MSDLTEFLLARVAEDERAANLVLRPYGDHAPSNDAAWWRDEVQWFRIGVSSDETPLLTRMNPQRVLAECEAKRRILEMHPETKVMGCESEPGCCDGCDGAPDWPCVTVLLLALPYADHPDCRQEWKP